MRYFPRPKTRDEVRAWLGRNIAFYEDPGFGTWYLESVDDGAFAGYCGIRPLALEGDREFELAWQVPRTRWNQGLATEAASAAIDLGFTRFGLTRLVAIIHPGNAASRAVARKLGMAEERALSVDGEPVVLYSVTVSR